jgi:hypothetical protein
MLNKNPDERITIEQLSQHPWIKSSPWEFYFQRSFQTWPLLSEDDQDVVQDLKRAGIDPEGADDQAAVIATRIVIRQRESRWVAHPELFLSGGDPRGIT